MQVRIARHTERLAEVVGFYRDGLGLPEIGGSAITTATTASSSGCRAPARTLELTAGGDHGAPAPHPESLPVLYLGDDAAVRAAAARLGREPVPPANPYWADHGLIFEDPDGFRVVLVPESWQG